MRSGRTQGAHPTEAVIGSIPRASHALQSTQSIKKRAQSRHIEAGGLRAPAGAMDTDTAMADARPGGEGAGNQPEASTSGATSAPKPTVIIVIGGTRTSAGAPAHAERHQRPRAPAGYSSVTVLPRASLPAAGMAGSGKTTLIQRLQSHLYSQQSPPYIINMDPAVTHMPYSPNIDIRDTVSTR